MKTTSSPARNPAPLLPVLCTLFFVFQSIQARAQNGLVALYTFEEGSGTTVQDVSGVGTPMNLTIRTPAAVDWLPGGGILIKANVLISSAGAATKILQAAQETSELSVEAYVKPANLTQGGPARMVTMSENPSNRNFTLGQAETQWAMRTRTPETGNNGSGGPGQFVSGEGTASVKLHHVVFTRTADGTETFYIDGQVVDTRFVSGDFSGWNAAYRFALGGELNNQRFWHGEMHKVAIYNRALTANEVMQIADDLIPKLEIANLSPFRGAHYHSAQSGITFRAAALANNTIAQNDIKMTLNGQDVSSQLQITGSATSWQVSYMGLEPNKAYEGEISIKDNAGRTSIAALEFETFVLRPDGLVALYTFEEGSGAVIQDRSESGPALDMTIADPTKVRWLAGGGLAIDDLVRIASSEPATKVMQPMQQSNALTVEAWVRSTGPQVGPARVVTMSLFRGNFPGSESDNSLRNFTLGQDGNSYSFHLRSSETDLAGSPPLESQEVTVESPTHLVYTRNPNGDARLYVNGVESASGTVGGDFSNWIIYFLGFGTELNEMSQAPADHRFRHWTGEMYRVALYSRAWSASEVTSSFNALGGNDTTSPTAPQNLQARAGAVFVELTWDASTDDSRRVFYEIQRNNETLATFIGANTYVDQSVSPSSSYTYRVRATDLAQNRSAYTDNVSATTTALAEVPGLVKAEFYTGIPGGGLLELLRAEPKFPANPDFTTFLPAAETPSGWGNDYGVRISGWFVPPQTGNYVFFMASDDEGEFWLSTDATPGNLKLIAYEPQWNSFRDWLTTNRRTPDSPDNRSETFLFTQWPNLEPATGYARIALQAGQRYYFEGIMKEGTGGDHLGVTYKLANEPDPGSGTPSRLSGDAVRTLGDPNFVLPIVKTPPQTQGVTIGQSVTLTVELAEHSSAPFTYQWQFAGQTIPGATSATFTIPSFQLANAGEYRVRVTNLAGETTSPTAFLGPKGNLVALYTFQEGSGATVRDSSNVGDPLDLTIADPAAVRWLPGGGISLDSQVLIASPGPATKIHDACLLTEELSVEAWVQTADLAQSGPARFVTMSVDTGNRNFTLGQDGAAYQFRLRTTTATDGNGNPNFLTVADSVETRLTYVVFTRSRDGVAKLYIDGALKGERIIGGTMANWNSGYRFGLGDEMTANRGWMGEMHRVAIYSYALTPEEITANFTAGPKAPPPVNQQPVTLSNLTRTGTTFRFDFTTASGKSYIVEYKDDLQQATWTPLQTIAGDGAVQSANDANAIVPVRFYRVRTE